MSRLDISVVDTEHLGGPVEALHLSTISSTCGSSVLNEGREIFDGEVGGGLAGRSLTASIWG